MQQFNSFKINGIDVFYVDAAVVYDAMASFSI